VSFDNAAVNAVRAAKFEPLKEPTWVNVPINFRLH
jgi:TonB family protein